MNRVDVEASMRRTTGWGLWAYAVLLVVVALLRADQLGLVGFVALVLAYWWLFGRAMERVNPIVWIRSGGVEA